MTKLEWQIKETLNQDWHTKLHPLHYGPSKVEGPSSAPHPKPFSNIEGHGNERLLHNVWPVTPSSENRRCFGAESHCLPRDGNRHTTPHTPPHTPPSRGCYCSYWSKKREKLAVVRCYGEDRLLRGVLMFVVLRRKVMFYKKLFQTWFSEFSVRIWPLSSLHRSWQQ